MSSSPLGVLAASSGANDLYARLVKKTESGAHPWVNRLFVLGLGIVAVLMVLDNRVQVYKYVLTYGWAILGASFGPQVILLLLWKRASYSGCVVGMLVGFVIAIVWPSVYDKDVTGIEVYNLPLAFVFALVVNIVVSLLSPSHTRATASEPSEAPTTGDGVCSSPIEGTTR